VTRDHPLGYGAAQQIAKALGGAAREGHGWRCRCPLHGGRSLVVRDGDQRRLLVKCWGGCNTLDVLAALRRNGLLNRPGEEQVHHLGRRHPEDHDAECTDAPKTTRALGIYHEARPIKGTIAEAYLRHCGIVLVTIPSCLRFHPACPHPCGKHFPAMVALVEREGSGFIGIHRTFLKPDGLGKAMVVPDKAGLGRVGGGAVRLAEARPGAWLALAEGIETTLSVMVATGLPAWAGLSAVGLEKVILPSTERAILICADNDDNGVGQRAARAAAERLVAEGRRVRLAIPPQPGMDFNDVLRGAHNFKNMEASDVAA
jgi:hypothetical protein